MWLWFYVPCWFNTSKENPCVNLLCDQKPNPLDVNLLLCCFPNERCCVYQLVFVRIPVCECACVCVCWNKSKVWEAICSQKLISVCEIRKQPLWCMVIRNTSPPCRPATAMHNHHDLFKWLMKYASVKSELLLLSSPFVPLPSFPSFFSQSIFFFVLGIVQPLRLSKSLPLCSAVAGDVWKTTRKQENYTRCMGPQHTTSNTPTLKAQRKRQAGAPRSGCMRDSWEKQKKTKEKNNFNQWRNIRKRRREDKSERGEESKQGGALIVLSCREKEGGRRWLNKRRRRVRGDGLIDGMR